MTAGGPVPVETEIKIPVPALGAVRERLVAAGARRLTRSHEELNTLYDDEAGGLAASGRALRLRRAEGKALVTFKGPVRLEGRIRHREEWETAVEDPGVFEKILSSLGLRPRFRYEKRREEFQIAECTVALDETPIGNFVEVEGSSDGIRAALTAIGLDPAPAVAESYPALYRRERGRNPALPEDMLFAR